MSFDISSVLLYITEISIVALFIHIYRKADKLQLHFMFLCNLGLMQVWLAAVSAQFYVWEFNPGLSQYFDAISYIGVCGFPVSILLTALVFARNSIQFSWRIPLLFLIPAVSLLVVWTNDFHHLFYARYSVIRSEIVPGKYFIIHAMYSYGCVLAGLFIFLYYSVRNTGLFSKQALLLYLSIL